jgi:hypothetical protein
MPCNAAQRSADVTDTGQCRVCALWCRRRRRCGNGVADMPCNAAQRSADVTDTGQCRVCALWCRRRRRLLRRRRWRVVLACAIQQRALQLRAGCGQSTQQAGVREALPLCQAVERNRFTRFITGWILKTASLCSVISTSERCVVARNASKYSMRFPA